MHGGLICITFCLNVCDWTKIHISGTIAPRVIKFGQNMNMDDSKVHPKGQGHSSKVKVTMSKNVILGLIWQAYR